jgi:hypothetical protein
MHPDDISRNCQARPVAAAFRVCDFLCVRRRLEQMVERILRHSNPSVGHRYFDGVAGNGKIDQDRPACWRELDGVSEEADEYLLEAH